MPSYLKMVLYGMLERTYENAEAGPREMAQQLKHLAPGNWEQEFESPVPMEISGGCNIPPVILVCERQRQDLWSKLAG